MKAKSDELLLVAGTSAYVFTVLLTTAIVFFGLALFSILTISLHNQWSSIVYAIILMMCFIFLISMGVGVILGRREVNTFLR
mmetsp:Transcript_33200/g.32296  ORF Transcript_33200/g.32296 Transcript_33200/m.32296 type:complete len:82 (+) Transcript_33200:132-377(+)